MSDAEFWNRVAGKYAALKVRDEGAYRHTLERTRSHLPPSARVLELGCGTGTTALHLADVAGAILATDRAPKMIEIARRKGATAANVRFETASIEAAGAQEAPFDVILAFNLLHLVDDLPGTLRLVRSRLREGGVFVSKTPCLRGKPHFQLLVTLMRLIGKAPRMTFLGAGELDRAVRKAGFDILESGDFPVSPPSRFIAARADA